MTPEQYAEKLARLHQERKASKQKHERKPLSAAQRNDVLAKTDSRCHLCGGPIESGAKWQADHVFSHAAGGGHSVDNYLPAHPVCNNYRWHYLPEEMEEIIKLGVWLKTQIGNQSKLGLEAAERFLKHEESKLRRRKAKTP